VGTFFFRLFDIGGFGLCGEIDGGFAVGFVPRIFEGDLGGIVGVLLMGFGDGPAGRVFWGLAYRDAKEEGKKEMSREARGD